jgi:hypothetical protein
MATTKQSIENLNKYTERLEILNKQLENTNKNTKQYKKLLEEKASVEKKATESAKQLAEAQSKLSSTLPSHIPLIQKASAAQQRYTNATTSSAKATKGFFGRLKSATGTLLRYAIAYRGINAAQTIFTELTVGSIREAIKFSKALANLGAVAGSTAEEVSVLGKNALDVAGSTKFTAEEIVGLQTELSKLGFSAEEVVKSTGAIAFAAQALGSPLNSTALLVGKVRNQFGLLVEQTSEIADTLVTSINESALSFDSFGTAMQYVGPIAKNLGLSLQQTSGAMAVLADNGFTASRIGTGLRGILTELGKTSADAEMSLKQLADRNISLSEAVDLVGKRNAAQLLTLLKNIDAIDELNSKYYQQGRALESSAKQINTFSGQVDILNSAFKEFQISIGDFIAKSDLVLVFLDMFSKEASETARAFQLITEIGFDKIEEDAKKIAAGADAQALAMERIQEQTGKTKEQIEEYLKVARGYTTISGDFVQANSAISSSFFGLIKQYESIVAAQKESEAITRGQAEANLVYGKTVEKLVKDSFEGLNVNKQIDEVYKNLEYSIGVLDDKIKKATDSRKTELKATKNVFLEMQEQLLNSRKNEDEILKIRTKNQEKSAKAEIKTIKDSIKEQIAAINERAKVETAVAEGAAERADIEAERQKLVSELYLEQADRIGQLNDKYETQTKLINDNVKAAEKLSAVLGSDVINDINNAYADYEKQLKGLKKARKEDKISQDDYEKGVTELRNQLISTIDTFRELFGTSPELEKFFDMVIMNFDATTVAADKTDKKTKEVAKTLDDFFKQFKEGEWLKYVEELFTSVGVVLDEFNETATENVTNELESQLSAIENRYEVEQDILKSQLDNQLITESQFRQKQLELRKAQLAEENSINKKIFESEKKQDVNDAKIEGLVAAAKAAIKAFETYGFTPAGIIAATLSSGIIAGQTAIQTSAINQRKFFPKKFAEGGMVDGPSHAEGGVPFTVQGRGGYEMEGGEFVVNKRATAMHRDLLERINSSYRTRPQVGRMKFADGGIIPSNPAAESVDYLKAIAEATTSTAIGVSKPVRAYVADKDLRNNATERRLRDRNDKI